MSALKANKGEVMVRLFYKTFFCVVVFVFAISFLGVGHAFAAKPFNNKIFYADSTNSGAAAPLAKFKKNANKLFKMMHMSKQQWISHLPSKAELGVPVYPGAVIVSSQQGYSDNGENLLPELVLVTSDPLKKVEAWYANKLKGWNHISNYDAFLPPHKNVDVMSDKFDATPHVQLEKIMTKNQLDGMFLKQPGNGKTGIIIRYDKK